MHDRTLLRPAPVLAGILAAALALALVPLVASPAHAAAGEVEITQGDGLIPSARFRGRSRFETAQLIATDETRFAADFDGGAVILARANDFPDALAGALVGGAERAPIVLTPTDTAADQGGLNPEVAEALDFYDERGLTDVFVLGGTAAVGDDVVQAVEAEYDAEVTRVSGMNRFETAATIATDFGGETSTVIVANGGNFPDALVSGAISAGGNVPILLTGSDGPLDPFTTQAIEDLEADTVVVAGGPAALSDSVEQQLNDLDSVETVTRVAGPSRVETAVEFAEYGEGIGLFEGDHQNLAFAFNFPDALALGPHAGLDVRGPAPILLTDSGAIPDSPVFTEYLESRDDCVGPVHAAGGIGVISEAALTAFRQALTADVDGALCFLELVPETQSAMVGESATVTAIGTDNLGDAPTESVTVTFAVERTGSSTAAPQPASGQATLDENGEATFAFSSPTPGEVVVTVTAEGFDGTTASDQAMAEFVLMGGGGDMGGGGTPDETPAQTFYALTNSPGTGLASYQTDQPGMVETITVIVDESGAPFGDDLVGIDFRSSTGELYALADTGGLFTIGIEMATAAPAALQQATATLVGMTDYDTALDVSEGVAFDFNPQVDKIRVLFGANGRNFVTDPDTASTSEFTVSGYQSGDANDGMDPQISATGYTRAASPAPSMTTQYSIDSAADVLTIQAKNEGTLTTVGELGIDAASADGFDIYDVDGDPATDDGFAFLQTGGSLYSVDLSSGEATEIGAFPPGGTFTGIAVVPAE